MVKKKMLTFSVLNYHIKINRTFFFSDEISIIRFVIICLSEAITGVNINDFNVSRCAIFNICQSRFHDYLYF